MTDNETKSEFLPVAEDRRTWMTPQLSKIGTLSGILGSGGGKISGSPGDPGDPNKPTGQG